MQRVTDDVLIKCVNCNGTGVRLFPGQSLVLVPRDLATRVSADNSAYCRHFGHPMADADAFAAILKGATDGK